MKFQIFKLGFIILFVFGNNLLTAQDDEPQTIHIKKESNLSKVVFDNTEFNLIIVDRFGNPKENRIVSYKLWIKGKSVNRPLEGYSNSLTPDMLSTLRKQTKATKIFFTEITAEDDNGHLVKLPDVIETWFPECSNCEPRNSKRR